MKILFIRNYCCARAYARELYFAVSVPLLAALALYLHLFTFIIIIIWGPRPLSTVIRNTGRVAKERERLVSDIAVREWMCACAADHNIFIRIQAYVEYTILWLFPHTKYPTRMIRPTRLKKKLITRNTRNNKKKSPDTMFVRMIWIGKIYILSSTWRMVIRIRIRNNNNRNVIRNTEDSFNWHWFFPYEVWAKEDEKKRFLLPFNS